MEKVSIMQASNNHFSSKYFFFCFQNVIAPLKRISYDMKSARFLYLLFLCGLLSMKHKKALFFSLILSLFLATIAMPVSSVAAETTTTLPKIENQSFAFTTTELMASFEGTGRTKTSTFTKKAPTIRKLAKKFFRSDEEVSISVANTQDEKIKVDVLDAEGKKATVSMAQTKTDDQVTIDIAPQTQFRPGKYKLIVTDSDGKKSEQDFFWGVLAINTNRSIYQPGQKANIAMAVLNEKGEMVCDAKVVLEITHKDTKETLSTENKKIVTNKQCISHGVSLEPDYEANYQTADEGTYDMTLTAETGKGKYTITDSFEVQQEQAFDVERISATRIYPPNNYPVKLNITANQDFDGIVTETVPESFVITPSDEAKTYDTAKTLYLEKKDDPSSSVLGAMIGPTASTSALALPFAGSYTITQKFGGIETANVLSKFYQHFGLAGHDGVDFGLPQNTPLFAADDGNIVFAGDGDYGITVIIQHAWGKSYYGHLSKVLVEKNTSVKKGQQIGFSGNTGESTGPHLHFSMKPESPDMTNGYFGKVDPLPYFNLPETSLIATNDQTVSVLGTSTEATHDETTPATKSANFDVVDSQLRNETLMNPTTPIHNKVKIITWHVTLKKGEKTTLSYQFKAPNISPQFYQLGALRFYPSNAKTHEPLFQETRQWQIAADAVGAEWYNDGTPYGGYSWQYRKAITMTSSSALIPATQTDFPVVVNLTSDPDLFTNAQSDGDDILFTDANGTKLSHELERYNTTSNGNLIAWVKVPSLSTSSVIYMYYGNPAVGSQQAATSVWDTNFKGVWHLKEDPSLTCASSRSICDSTSNAANATDVGLGAAQQVAGQIDGSMNFPTLSSNVIAVPTMTNSTATWTIEAWIKPSVVAVDGAYRTIYCSQTICANYYMQVVDKEIECGFNVGAVNADRTTGWNPTANTWYHVACTFNNSTDTIKIYANGTQILTMSTATGTPTANTATWIGDTGASGNSETWEGGLDEARISGIDRSANWIKTEYSNQNSPSTFYTLGNVETKNYAASPAQLMRHGQFFNSAGVSQPLTY